MPDDELIGTTEACRILGGIAVSTLTRWVANGKITPAHKMPGASGAFLFTRAEIDRVSAKVPAAP
jgi:predicted site-specific integrase-resolvase